LREISRFIARNAPVTALGFIRRLKLAVNRLRDFPESGQIVSETDRLNVREVLHGSYRIIYRIEFDRIDVLTVFHSAQLLDDTSF
jgi:toxin ParE1/3/4